ncbi:hypothetical protein ACFWN1_11740 [Streptomyces sp. NPDC058459]|uniref:hypothetical protein n=1 Tax=Streptomyces sp. NPDC058459 TaxID=3346508 RepID=UPI003659BEED
MTSFFSGLLSHGTAARRAFAAPALAVCGLVSLTGCGKVIQIGDSSAPPTSASAPATSAPAPATSSAAPAAPAQGGAGNSALQVVDSTASDAGLNGTGGTVIGAAVQETPPKWVQLSAVTSPDLATPHLININQAALYRFDADSAESGESNCNDACATKWPPVIIKDGGNVYLAGVNPKDVGAIRRADGKVQVTVGGRPVYRFSGDAGAGDLNGQGLDGKWFAVGPKGQKAVR